jgi:hypothetical protein
MDEPHRLQSEGRAGREVPQRQGRNWNASSLDDGQTQSALRFLMAADEALGFKEPAIHEAAAIRSRRPAAGSVPERRVPAGLDGARGRQAVLPASYPDYDWKSDGRREELLGPLHAQRRPGGSVLETLIEARRIYPGRARGADDRELGDFLILAQMPERSRLGAAVHVRDAARRGAQVRAAGRSAAGNRGRDGGADPDRRRHSKPKYLEPVRGAGVLKKSLLPDGRLARFYELKSNKPLYMDAQYKLTYDDGDAPAHYGWKQPRVSTGSRSARVAEKGAPDGEARAPGEGEARKVLAALDEQGRWVSVYNGEPLVGQPKFASSFAYLSSAVFSRNVETLSAYLASKAK